MLVLLRNYRLLYLLARRNHRKIMQKVVGMIANAAGASVNIAVANVANVVADAINNRA